MSRLLSGTLTAEMGSLDRHPSSHVTVERWLPEWTARISGLSGGQTEKYAHGHSVATALVSGETVICRARSGSFASPQNGRLYISVIRDANLDTPANWDSLWVDTGITGLMYPAWTANSGAAHGGSIAVVDSGSNFRVFYLLATGNLRYVDVSYTGTVSGSTSIASLGTGVQLASMQIASCLSTEVFVILNPLVEGSLAAWHKDMYGSFIRRYYYSGGWGWDDSFHFHTHSEAGLFRDSPQEGNDFGDSSCTGIIAQWGKRWCGGLAASQIDANTVLISLGITFWRRWGYDTHFHGVSSFIYHRDSVWWERGPEIDQADFTEGNRLGFSSFVRGCNVEGSNFLIWNRNNEPSDFEQLASGQNIPRIQEVVYSKLSGDGKYLTQFQYLGDQDNLTAASLVVVTRNGVKKLFAIGWRSVYESEPAAFVCSVSSPQDLDLYTDGWDLSRNNRMGMTLDLNLYDPSILTDNTIKAGWLARVYYGIPGELVQAGQAFLDQNTPKLTANENGEFTEGASVTCQADDLLINTRAETVEDVLPQNTMLIPPDDPIQHVQLSKGVWGLARMTWPTMFFPGTYDSLQDQPCWRLFSFPPAQTGHDLRTDLKSSWFKDITWLSMQPMVDGAIEASVRFGDVYNESNFTFEATNGDALYTTINRSNGVITNIQWRTGGFGGAVWNTVTQYACMAGLICHAPEVGRKYAFVWEYESNFAVSSHTDDTWTQENFDRADYSTHGIGTNKLYLILSDYDGDNWVNKSVAGGITATGLTPGQPADLRMQVIGGTIYCYYRAHSTGIPNQWRFAFSYKAGRFGAGVFGLVGRGHAGIQWGLFQPGVQYLAKCDNVVDFWNIKLSDAVKDQTLEEHLKRYCWRGFSESEFVPLVIDNSRVVSSGTFYNYLQPIENPTIDFKLSIPANGNEGGVLLRGIAPGGAEHEGIRIGLVAHSTANSATNTVSYYVVKRRYSGGVEVSWAREYCPIPIQLFPGRPVPVRVTVRGTVYSIWIAGNFAGHFIDDTPLGLYFGLYSVGGNCTFTNVYVPELYEIPASALQEINQTMADAIRNVIGKRRVKAIFEYDGTIKFSYFLTHEIGPALNDSLWQSSLQRSPRYISKLRVQGSGSHAIYQSALLAARGQRYQVVNNSDILLSEFAYREAQALLTETAEEQVQATFDGLPDLQIDPEDQVTITVTRQAVSGNYIASDIKINFKMGDSPDSSMTISTRQTVAL